MEQVLDRAQLGIPPDQRRLQAIQPLDTAYSGQHSGGSPQRHRLGFPLERVLPGRGEADPVGGQPLGGRIDQHLARLGHGLHSRRGVHRVTGHHALADRAQRHRHLAGHHPGPGRQAGHTGLGAEFRYLCDQVHRGPDGPLGASLGGHRRAPHGHHRVPDELLHHPAVPADHRPGHVEVLGQQFPHSLRITRLGQRGEPGNIAKEQRAHPPLGDPVLV